MRAGKRIQCSDGHSSSTLQRQMAPVIDSFDLTTVSGTAEAGSTITVYDENGTEIGSGTADSTGNYTVTLATPLANGEEISENKKKKKDN